MWEQLKDHIKNFFFEEIEENEKSLNSRTIHHQSIETKMKYQYPKSTPFRFPVIPDIDKQHGHKMNIENESEVPAYQRKRRVQQDKRKLDEKVETTSTKRRFVPSEVASPIYGYKTRKKEKEIEDVPTFVRNRRIEENKPTQQEDFNYNTFNEKRDYTAEQNEEKIPLAEKIKAKDHIIIDEETTIDETKEIAPEIRDEATLHTEKENEAYPLRDDHAHMQQQQRRNVKQRNKRNSKKSIPFNVIMTPWDKKKLNMHKQKKQQSINVKDAKGNDQKKYSLPMHLLNDPEPTTKEDRLWVQQQQRLLERTLKHFNVQAKVVQATQGPTVTRFEVQPELGVKVSKVRNLSDDIKMNLSAKDIRIEAPIPGKNTIGIEVPNMHAQKVGLQEILETDMFRSSNSPLTVGLGLNVEGKPLITNIAKMPHGLIAGATGSGKSVCINTILISLLYKSSFEDVKLLLIDPKMVELAPYNDIPHLVSPVITDIKAATAALKWAVDEMEDRYEKFVHEGVRDIHRYNEKVIKENRRENKMPFLVIVIDELADLMMVSPQDVEDSICRIAQKARACGIHLLIATQRPSVDVITGLIKANIPSRIAFSVSSQVDSRTIIDASGAERLLGKGDMLFIENGSGKSVRLQGAFVSDEEIERVTNYVRKLSSPKYIFQQEQLLKQVEMEEEEDELLVDAIKFLLNQHHVSTSLLQRHFRIGYNRAARLIDSLENKGIISGPNGSKPRDVLLSTTQLEDLLQTNHQEIGNVLE